MACPGRATSVLHGHVAAAVGVAQHRAVVVSVGFTKHHPKRKPEFKSFAQPIDKSDHVTFEIAQRLACHKPFKQPVREPALC